MKKKVLIVTLNDYILYQPSILNLYDFLFPYFDVTIISFQPKFSTKEKDTSRNIVYLKTDSITEQVYLKTDFFLSKFTRFIKKLSPNYTYYHRYYHKYLPGILEKYLKTRKSEDDIVIAADFPALYVAQKIYGAVHLISLEIDNNTNRYYKLIDPGKVKSVFVQSQVRYDYLFGEKKIRTFLVPNAPVYKPVNAGQKERKDFIWGGSIDRRLAIFDGLNFFKLHPEYRLVLKGGGDQKTRRLIDRDYGDLVKEHRIIFNQEYLPEESFVSFLSGFRIGFCFYSWELIKESFNYRTAPSGKIMMYMAAGTPVIACNIPAFHYIRDFNAGILIDDYNPETIQHAINTIESDYASYSNGCYRVAREFSFDRNVMPYIDFLRKEAGI